MARRINNMCRTLLGGMLIFFAFVSLCSAEQTTDGKDTLDIPSDSGLPTGGLDSVNVFGTLFKVIFVLILIIGLIVLLIKMLAKKNNGWMSNRSVRIISVIALGQNKSMQIVEIGQSIYIVGVGDHITLIDKIKDEDEVAAIVQAMNAEASGGGMNLISVGNWLKNMRKKQGFEKIDVAMDAETQDSSFQQVFYDKMKNVSNRKKLVEHLMHEQNDKERSNDP